MLRITEVFENVLSEASNTFLRCIRDRRLTDEILMTTFCLLEQCLNARPNTSHSTNPPNLDALTLNHFLLGTARSTLPTHSRPTAEVDHGKRYLRAQAYSDAVWNRWLKEYLPNLNPRSKWSKLSNRDLKTGYLVWIVEPTVPRVHYPHARVVMLNYGTNADARSTEVKTSTSFLVRPVVKLASVFSPFQSKLHFVSFQRTLIFFFKHVRTINSKVFVPFFLHIFLGLEDVVHSLG